MKAFKKIALSFLLTALAIPAFVAQAGSFNDVTSSGQNYTAIEYLVSSGTLEGYADGTFRPNQTINRAELMKVLVSGQGVEPDATLYQNCFSDVSNQWFAKYICYAKAQSWVDGYSDGTFRPGSVVNRVEAAKMISEAYGFAPIESDESIFDDVRPSDWFSGYIQTLNRTGVIDAEANTYSPSNEMTRGLTSEYIFRVLVANSNDEEIYTSSHSQEFLEEKGLESLIQTETETTIEPEVDETEVEHYTNVDGETIQSPAQYSSQPAGATAQCEDGSYSFSQHRSGTCSHHGGVLIWY